MAREALIVPLLLCSLGIPEARAQEVDLSLLKIMEGQAGVAPRVHLHAEDVHPAR